MPMATRSPRLGTSSAELRAGRHRRLAHSVRWAASRAHPPRRPRFLRQGGCGSLETTVAGVNGALLRARGTVQRRQPDRRRQASPRTLGDRRLREIAERIADAFERGEVDAILAMLAPEATLASGDSLGDAGRAQSGRARGCSGREGDLAMAEETAAALRAPRRVARQVEDSGPDHRWRGAPAQVIDALDTFERLPGGALLHLVDAREGDGEGRGRRDHRLRPRSRALPRSTSAATGPTRTRQASIVTVVRWSGPCAAPGTGSRASSTTGAARSRVTGRYSTRSRTGRRGWTSL